MHIFFNWNVRKFKYFCLPCTSKMLQRWTRLFLIQHLGWFCVIQILSFWNPLGLCWWVQTLRCFLKKHMRRKRKRKKEGCFTKHVVQPLVSAQTWRNPYMWMGGSWGCPLQNCCMHRWVHLNFKGVKGRTKAWKLFHKSTWRIWLQTTELLT